MTRSLFGLFFLALVLLARPVPSRAQTYWGSIDITSDPEGTDCNVPTSGLVSLYVIARPDLSVGTAAGFFAVEFRVDLSEVLAAGATYVGEESQGYVTIGSIVPGPGVQLGFLGCQKADLHVYTVRLSWDAVPSGTFHVSIVPSTLATSFLAMDECSSLRYIHPVLAGTAVASTEGVSCDVAARETTWGTVKALYGE
jgi:hypothetical protein